MWWNDFYKRFLGRPITGRPAVTRRRTVRLSLERLEDRTLPSSYTAASVSDLIADINAANLAGGSNTIALVVGRTYSLTAVNDTTDGYTGLPRIAANDNLTILGNGDVIQRSTAKGTPAFRLFDVVNGASLTLANLTVQNGSVVSPRPSPSAAWEQGGAIYNQGALTLNGVTVQNNAAQGFNFSAAGGGIYSSGSLTLAGDTKIQNNQALGANGDNGVNSGRVIGNGAPGGDGLGGGLYVSGGSATLTNVTLSGNIAAGGNGGNGANNGNYSTPGGAGGNGGNGLGGGLYAAGGTLTMQYDTVTMNSAKGGSGGHGGSGSPPGANGNPGLGEGGGVYIDAALVYLDAYTQANVKKNQATTSEANIHGSFSTYP